VAVSVVRGLGFGLTVVTGALTAALLPPERRGEGLGLFGVVSGVPEVVALPAGVWLAGHHLATPRLSAMTAATAPVPLAAVRWLPGVGDRRTRGNSPTTPGRADGRIPSGLRDGRQLRLPSSSPPARSRPAWSTRSSRSPPGYPQRPRLGRPARPGDHRHDQPLVGGRHGDRHGHARLLIPGWPSRPLGMAAMIWLGSPVAVIAGMCLFGAGFGIIRERHVRADDRACQRPRSARPAPLWNLAYDAGYGARARPPFGLICGPHRLPGRPFALTGALILADDDPDQGHEHDGGERPGTP
jgi:MFS family permease